MLESIDGVAGAVPERGVVVADIVLLSMLAAFALACLLHASIWFRNAAEREHFWFALASLAAAGAVAMQWIDIRNAATALGVAARPLMAVCIVLWLVSISWFVTEYGGGDRWRRRAAGLATALLLLLATTGLLAGPEALFASGSAWRAVAGALIVLSIGIVFGLCIDAAIRLHRTRRSRALANVVIAGALVLVAARGSWPPGTTPDPAWLVAFLLVVLLMLHELATLVADSKLAAQRQGHELAHASRLSVVGELSAAIAHEINQPLGAILNNADAGEILLEDPDPPLEEIRKILADIRRDGLRASQVIRQLRRLVKKREMELEKLDANQVVADVIALLAAETRRRRLVIGSVIPPEPRFVRGDRALLEQVLINLVLNAMDALESLPSAARRSRAAIELGVDTTGHGEVEIWIQDAGPGIPAAHLRHLFDSFYTSKPHGMGLGLSIARSIVEAHGGRIQVENTSDSGACFRITLPPFCD